jgi:predicted membrane-bound spermidine synthase/tetratricopeptide (TPR) repeat protein
MTRLLAVCFFVTGAAGLVYEVVWARHLALLFGATAEAVGLVLAVYMAGLGLGAPLFGRLADRARSPLRVYAMLEAGIGALALLTTPLLSLVRSAYPALAGGGTGLRVVAVKAGLSAAVLLPATLLMGGTLPALSRALGRDAELAPRAVSLLYALNIAGAVAGTLLSGFLLIERLGLSRSMALAAAADLAVAAAVGLFARGDAGRDVEGAAATPAPLAARPSARLTAGVLLGLFGSGATFMAYEVVFTRLFGLVFGVSSYAFALTLGVCLAGLGAGGFVAARLVKRRPATLTLFGATQIGVSAAAALACAAVPLVPRAVALARQVPELGFTPTLLVKAALAAALLFPLSALAGLGVPLLLAYVSRDVGRLGTRVGRASLVNIAGTLLGSLATGFFLVTALGSEGTLRLAAGVSLAVGVAAILLERGQRGLAALPAAAAVAVLLLFVPRWPLWVFLRSDTSPREAPATTRLELERRVTLAGHQTLFFEEGRNATVAVIASATTRTLLSNGHPEASDTGDMLTQWGVSAIALAVHPAPSDVLVVGLASGVTAGAAARVPEVARVDVVELEQAMSRASAFFHHVNGDVLTSPRVTVTADDARSFVRTAPRRYDVIISEPSNLWRSGVTSLFSADFYADARRVLKDGGLFAQWVQTYGLGFDSVRRVFATFGRSFREVQVWWLDGGDLVLLGSDKPMPLDRRRVDVLFGTVFAGETRLYAKADSPGEIWARYLLGTAEAAAIAGDVRVHTDDRPLLEFEAVRGLFTAPGGNGLRLLREKLGRQVWLPPHAGEPPSDGEIWLGLAGMYEGIGEISLARAAALRAVDIGATPVALLRAGRLALEEGEVTGARRSLAEARRSTLSPRLARDADILEGRIARAEDRPADALKAFRRAEQEGDAGLRLLEVLIEAGRSDEAFTEAERLLSRARLGGEPGAGEVAGVWDRLAESAASPEEARRAAALVERQPSPDAGFPRLPRLKALARLRDKAGLAAGVRIACESFEALGDRLDPQVLRLHAQALRALGRPREAAAVEARRRALEPLAGD